MMTFKNKVNDIAQIKDFYTFAEVRGSTGRVCD